MIPTHTVPPLLNSALSHKIQEIIGYTLDNWSYVIRTFSQCEG